MENSIFPTRKLGLLCSKISSGATPRGGCDVYLERGETALIRSQNVRNEHFTKNGLVFIEQVHANQLANVAVQNGDVLLNITGDSVARCCQVDPAVLPARVNQHVAIIRPKPDELNPRFLRYFLVSPHMQAYMLSLSGAGATRNALTKEMLVSFEVPVPSLLEQNAIADILGALDDKIELNRRINETLEAIAQALFKSWFVDFDPVIDKALAAGKEIPEPLQEKAKRRRVLGDMRRHIPPDIENLFPDEFIESELGWIPLGWECGTLSRLAELNPGEKLRKGQDCAFIDMKAVPQTGSCISKVIRKPFTSGSKFKNGDVLLARITPCLENGKTALVQCFKSGEIGHGSTEFIVLRSVHQESSGLLYLIARDEVFREYCVSNMTGSSGRQRVEATRVAGYPMPIPPVALIDHFSSMTVDMFAKIGRLNGENQTLGLARQTLLPRLLSGELRVPEAENKLVETARE